MKALLGGVHVSWVERLESVLVTENVSYRLGRRWVDLSKFASLVRADEWCEIHPKGLTLWYVYSG